MKNKIVLSILFLFSGFALYAQNARFSQVFSAPSQMNPGLTGRFDGKIRIGSLSSWQTADKGTNRNWFKMNHQNISGEVKIGAYRNYGDDANTQDSSKKLLMLPTKSFQEKDVVNMNKKNNGYWAVGANYYNYHHETSPLTASFYSVSLARHFYNRSNKFFGFGIQGVYATGNLDETITTSRYNVEISGGGFGYPFTNSNNNYIKSKNYYDYSVGGYYGMTSEAVMFEIGLAMNHLFYPANNFVYDKEDPTDISHLRHRITADALLRLKCNSNWGLIIKNILWQDGLYLRSKKQNNIDSLNPVAFWSGVEFYKINPASNYNLNFGLYTRTFKTIIPYININISNFGNLRYSYERALASKKYTLVIPKRNELALILSIGRNTAPGTKFYRKINFW